MDAVGAAASILAIAGAGIQISLKLIAFADQVGTAPKRIQDIGTDVSVTAGTLQELGELMKNTSRKKSAGIFKPDQVQNIEASSFRCKDIFEELKDILSIASQQLRVIYKSTAKSPDTPPKIKLSRIERMKWPFLQPSMEPLQSALRDAKGTLTLILQVVHLRHAHTTASLDREEQNDLIRMIASIRRQQLAPSDKDNGGSKALDVSNAEYSDTEGSSDSRIILEAWSVTPNTYSDDAFQHFQITPMPVSQQQIVNASPQDLHEVALMIDSLSPPERNAIFGMILGERRPGSDESSLRSITAQSWTGSHDLFGKVSGRKFNVIIERKVWIYKFPRVDVVHRTRKAQHIPEMDRYHSHYQSDSNPTMYDNLSDETERRRPHQAPSPPDFPERRSERRRPVSGDDWKRKHEIKEKKRLEEKMLQKEEKKKGSSQSQSRTEGQPANASSDDDLVKSLLAQYTNFDPGEPLVQDFVTPSPTYDDAFVILERMRRRY